MPWKLPLMILDFVEQIQTHPKGKTSNKDFLGGTCYVAQLEDGRRFECSFYDSWLFFVRLITCVLFTAILITASNTMFLLVPCNLPNAFPREIRILHSSYPCGPI